MEKEGLLFRKREGTGLRKGEGNQNSPCMWLLSPLGVVTAPHRLLLHLPRVALHRHPRPMPPPA